jgi:hypothetical protein
VKVSHMLVVVTLIQINTGTSITSHAVLKADLCQANEFLICKQCTTMKPALKFSNDITCKLFHLQVEQHEPG